jgi:hypothetical protein
MRNPDRIEPTLDLLAKVWKRHPDWRLSQVVVNALDVTSPEVFYAEDEALEAGLQRLREQYGD